MPKILRDVYIWERFWALTITDSIMDKDRKVWCICLCWNEKRIKKERLINWYTTNCWCRCNVLKNSRHIWDGVFNPKVNPDDLRFHTIFNWMNTRCWREGPRKDVKNERATFKDFYDDMYPSYIEHINMYWAKQTTIDRVDPKWNYCKENCRRATYSEQSGNKRNLDHYIIWWKKYKLSELVEITWLTHSKVIRRYKKYIEGKYSEEKMLYRWRIKWNHYTKAWPI